jgi:acetyl esterase/lipase
MDIHSPRVAGQLPTVVLAHSVNGVKEDLTQFGHALAAAGARVCNVDWRGHGTAETFPAGYHNLAAAVRHTRRHAADVTLVTWSDGAIAGTVVTLDPRLRSAGGADRFIGLGGYYGWPDELPPPEVVNERTTAFFGSDPETDPRPWRNGNPYRHLKGALELPLVLIVGDQDPLRDHAESFAGALTAADHRVRVVIVPGCGHADLVMPRFPAGRQTIHAVLAAIAGERG